LSRKAPNESITSAARNDSTPQTAPILGHQGRPDHCAPAAVAAFLGLADATDGGHAGDAEAFRRDLAALWLDVTVTDPRGPRVATRTFREYAEAIDAGRLDLAIGPRRELQRLGVVVLLRRPKGDIAAPEIPPTGEYSPRTCSKETHCVCHAGPKRKTGPRRLVATPGPFDSRSHGPDPASTPGQDRTLTPFASGE
jgi:hypothetical protein